MEYHYEVYMGSDAVGKVNIIKQGLYYRVLCRCIVPSDTVYRLYAITETGREKLGVLIPDGDGVLLDRKIPVKRLQEFSRFILSSRSDEDKGRFVPIYPEEPFSYIGQLENAFLEIQNGQVGVCIKDSSGAD